MKPSYIHDFSVSTPLESEEGGPGGRRDDPHGAPQHVGHQGDQDERQLELLVGISHISSKTINQE